MEIRFKKYLFSWRSVPLSKKLFLLVGSMVVLIVLELIILSYAMTNLSAVRAYVAGEGEWSKAQKNAFYSFERYSRTRNQDDYHQIFHSLSVIEGDLNARTELGKPNPDLEFVRSGFLQGHVHPEDVENMIYFFRRFQDLTYMKRAIFHWEKADQVIIEFKSIIALYRSHLNDNTLTQDTESGLLKRVQQLNEAVTIHEKAFSETLSEGSRWMEQQIFIVLFALVMTVSVFGISLTFLIGRSITSRLNALNRLAAEYGLGNFDRQLPIEGQDEIGKLTYSINKMGSLLSSSYQQILESHQDLERKVHERTAELKSALTIRDEFLSIANHELRTPLTAIVLQLRIVERTVENCPDCAELDKVKDSIRKTNRLVKKLVDLQNSLMDLTHIHLGKFQIRPESCDLTNIATESLSQLSLEASRNGVTIKTIFPENLSGKFDPLRSSQVITNLVSNALKYGEGKPIELQISDAGGKAVLVVTDHGPGIPQEKMATIFDRFERGDHDKSLSGLGLGLYITRQIVEAHGGSIYVHNVEGKGARFTAEFPL